MPPYYVNKVAQPNGDHEVHTDGCPHPAEIRNRHPLGGHLSCYSAVSAAKLIYPKANGCYYCSNPCHTT